MCLPGFLRRGTDCAFEYAIGTTLARLVKSTHQRNREIRTWKLQSILPSPSGVVGSYDSTIVYHFFFDFLYSKWKMNPPSCRDGPTWVLFSLLFNATCTTHHCTTYYAMTAWIHASSWYALNALPLVLFNGCWQPRAWVPTILSKSVKTLSRHTTTAWYRFVL